MRIPAAYRTERFGLIEGKYGIEARFADFVERGFGDFEAAVFSDALALTVFDAARSQSEERWFTLGHDRTGNLLVVTHTYQTTDTVTVRIRIISARKATPHERRYHEDKPR